MLLVYGWVYSFMEKKQDGHKTLAIGAQADQQCENEATVEKQKNPNIKLFISCGGFLE